MAYFNYYLFLIDYDKKWSKEKWKLRNLKRLLVIFP
jgi:hypothetical protein